MLFKKELMETINCLSHDLTALYIRVEKLEDKVRNLELYAPNTSDVAKKVSQPRDKSGKFTKKK